MICLWTFLLLGTYILIWPTDCLKNIVHHIDILCTYF